MIENSVNECIADGLRRRQSMLNDFNKAQEMLKEKISDLTQNLAVAENKFKNRESLDEDTEMIENLKVCSLLNSIFLISK